ncbi:hypothetical protein SAMN05421690_101448 [Nitrosomonas sp. Nm51]|nr:hypothetical protein [Nitrosomonas sp. Nm51]SER25101.1 hypothetical protein SAMN05421690_101448 [Nitrosomonas sp. Nm51]
MNLTKNFLILSIGTFLVVFFLGVIASTVVSKAGEQDVTQNLSKAA